MSDNLQAISNPTESDAAKTHPAFRLLLAAAAGMNVVIGAWAGASPASFCKYWRLGTLGDSRLFVYLGTAIALYGLLYAYAAWRPDQGDVVAAVGLAGKVLSPLAWLWAVWLGELKPHTVALILLTDVIWWFLLLTYLLRRSRWNRTIVVWVGVTIHVIGCLGLLAVRGGTEVEPEMVARMRWIAAHIPLWTTTWFVWIAASISLVAFFFAWYWRLLDFAPSEQTQLLILVGMFLCVSGFLSDLAGELVNLSAGTDPALTDPVLLANAEMSADSFGELTRFSSMLGAGIANGLYCLAGLMMSGVSWRVGLVRGWLGVCGFAMWSVGLGLTVATFVDHRQAMVVSGGAVMVLFIPWSALVGWRLRATTTIDS